MTSRCSATDSDWTPSMPSNWSSNSRNISGSIIKNQSEGRSILQSVNTISAFIEKRQGA